MVKTTDKSLGTEEGDGEAFFVVTHISAVHHNLLDEINDEFDLGDRGSIIYQDICYVSYVLLIHIDDV